TGLAAQIRGARRARAAPLGTGFVLTLAPSSLRLEPPANSGRFKLKQGSFAEYDAHLLALHLTNVVAVLRREAADTDVPRRSRVERAFEHLNRSLVVDRDLRSRWLTALADREEYCEALGAVHLLLNGVFAFKVNAQGGRTDLVLGGEVEATPAVRGSDALVLTEWKIVRDESERATLARQARVQARQYSGGVLAGVELRTTRFVVLVSSGNGPTIPDITEDAILYRHVNVTVNSRPPSAVARMTPA
ncbi:MAG: hypothetical protein AB7O24_29075, partial [Kofleriaceae bacterium]